MEFSVKLPLLGVLSMEHIFYILGTDPILFVCMDNEKRRYLCSCCKLGEEWVISQVSDNVLITLMEAQLTIRAAFETSGNPIFFVHWDGEQFFISQPAPDDALPRKGALLQLGNKVAQYSQELGKYEKE